MIAFLDLENYIVDTNIRSLALIELELWSFICKKSATLAAIWFSDRPMLNMMKSLHFLIPKTIKFTPP